MMGVCPLPPGLRETDADAPVPSDAANDALRGFASDADVVLLSYVLQEVGTLGCWRQCVRALWRHARAGCVFYVKDPNDRTARQVLELLGGAGEEGPAGGRLRQGVDWCWCCGDALLLLKPAAASETAAAGEGRFFADSGSDEQAKYEVIFAKAY